MSMSAGALRRAALQTACEHTLTCTATAAAPCFGTHPAQKPLGCGRLSYRQCCACSAPATLRLAALEDPALVFGTSRDVDLSVFRNAEGRDRPRWLLHGSATRLVCRVIDLYQP